MAETLLERAWAWLHQTFPERQIYIRSDGRVQFFTFGPSLQATMAGLCLIFLGWVAFATVNVIFKDRIIAAKDHRYQQMQAAYENRVTELQFSYDELNGALISAEDKFKATANELQRKQNTIINFLNQRQQVRNLLGSSNTGITNLDVTDTGAAVRGQAIDSVTAPIAPAPSEGTSELGILPQPVAPAPRSGKAIKASFLDLGAIKQTFASLFGRRSEMSPEAFANHPALKELAQQTDRVRKIGADETRLMAQTQVELARGVDALKTAMTRTGINPDKFVRRVAQKHGMGGPEISLQNFRLDGISDAAFHKAYQGATTVLSELNLLMTSMRYIPLTTPVSGSAFERSSGFGTRFDPFSGRPAFHSGLDFSGPWGAKIAATAAGTVKFAGYSGAYGNMVEIDHGFGINTRYGHLSSIAVRPGTKVEKGTTVGKLGSTGRSTGPHVHYEIWYEDVVRNPSKFIEAGRNVH